MGGESALSGSRHTSNLMQGLAEGFLNVPGSPAFVLCCADTFRLTPPFLCRVFSKDKDCSELKSNDLILPFVLSFPHALLPGENLKMKFNLT